MAGEEAASFEPMELLPACVIAEQHSRAVNRSRSMILPFKASRPAGLWLPDEQVRCQSQVCSSRLALTVFAELNCRRCSIASTHQSPSPRLPLTR